MDPAQVQEISITWARLAPGLTLLAVLGLTAWAGVRWVVLPLLRAGAELVREGIELERSRDRSTPRESGRPG